MAIARNDYSRLGPAARQFLDRAHGHFIAGEWVAAGPSLDVIDPASGERISSIAAGSAVQIDSAVQAAHHAFHSPAWRNLPPLSVSA